MPTYGYECTSCGYSFEKVQMMSEEPIAACPECGKAVRRLISGGLGVIFKGTGFYVNDSKSSGKAVANDKKNTAAKKVEEKKSETSAPPPATLSSESAAPKKETA